MTRHLNESSGVPKRAAPWPVWALPILIHHDSRKSRMIVVTSREVIYPLCF